MGPAIYILSSIKLQTDLLPDAHISNIIKVSISLNYKLHVKKLKNRRKNEISTMVGY